MLFIIETGGSIGLILLGLSVLALFASLERLWSLRINLVVPVGLLRDTEKLIIAEGVVDTKTLGRLSPLGSVFAEIIHHFAAGENAAREAMRAQIVRVAYQLEVNLNTLAIVAQIAPMLGLLGTVVGMIEVFNQAMQEATSRADALASGIGGALVTTAMGLVVAVPALVIHRMLSRKVETLLVTVEQEAGALVNFLFPHKATSVPEQLPPEGAPAIDRAGVRQELDPADRKDKE